MVSEAPIPAAGIVVKTTVITIDRATNSKTTKTTTKVIVPNTVSEAKSGEACAGVRKQWGRWMRSDAGFDRPQGRARMCTSLNVVASSKPSYDRPLFCLWR